jgi:hypothetical protein
MRPPSVTATARSGSSAMMSRAETDPMPLPMICKRDARSAADGMAARAPAIDPIWIQVSGAPRSVRAVSMGIMARAAGSPHT